MRAINQLTALKIARLSKPGRYGDGLGLWLQVSSSGTKAWLFRFQRDGRQRQMGLGPVHTVTLADAREKATECRRLLLAGVDPIDAKHGRRRTVALEAARSITFRECAEKYVEAHGSGWRNDKHRAQWTSTLATYVYPLIGALSVASIDTALVLKVIESIWKSKPETAGRIRGRIELVLDWAAAREYRAKENPARWKGHLDKLLAPKPKAVHHAALAYRDLPAFTAALRARNGVSARCLEFVILTAGRTGEAISARWAEIDLGARLWTVPAARMKSGREHRVPLSDRAVAILNALPREGDFLFIGARAAKPLSNMALLKTLHDMGRDDLTTHGFRSTFRDWAAEQTNYPSDVAEMALAHAVGDKVEAAYRRGDLFEKRRQLANEWARYCTSPTRGKGADVVPIRKR